MSKKEQQIKCCIWDLDNTIWNGTLLEDKQIVLNQLAVSIIVELDKRGILQSIVSKNNYDEAMEKLKSFGLADYFLCPQINWQPKPSSIKQITKSLNIGNDACAFIDDQQFELDDVSFTLPEVLTIHMTDMHEILDMPPFIPRFITEDSKMRRKMYQNDLRRNQIENSFVGSKEEFLQTLNMKLTISSATENDLQRAEELTVRTNQLNTTGYTYSYDELNTFRKSNSHKLLIIGLNDKYGHYGTIGLILLDMTGASWVIKLFLMSCRVMSRGIGSVLIHYLRKAAKVYNVKLMAEFVETARNRMMYMTYKFTNFNEKEKDGSFILFENDLNFIPEFPSYLQIEDNVCLI